VDWVGQMERLKFMVNQITRRNPVKSRVKRILSQLFRSYKYLSLMAIAIILIFTINFPTLSAEKIEFNYNLLGFKILVKDLADFAQQGIISSHLNFYLKRIPTERRDDLRQFLNQSYDVDPILVYRYSRSSVGIKLLKRIGEIIQLPGQINGFYGLRAAVVQTAQSKSGINFISFLHQFPTNINLNLEGIIELVKQISNSEKDTQAFIANLNQHEAVTKSNLTNSKNIPNLAQAGKYKTNRINLNLYDQKRDRLLKTDLYLPQINSTSIPVIVVSNGLGANRDRFDELAFHLSSYGFAVVICDHPGSDRDRQKAFLKGLYRDNFDATDFINRPLDISYILDELALLNPKQFNNQLNLEQVGIFGYSIGGTTALSLAGANLDIERLATQCAQPLDLLNISTLYQCRAVELSRQKQSLKDERIKAAFMFVPFGNAMFSQAELNKVTIPMMWQVVDRDFLTSLLREQVPLFNDLTNSDRWLVISEKLPHSNVTLSKEQQSKQIKIFKIAKNYQNILSLVFFQNYIAQNQEYGKYLNLEFIQAIEEQPYKLHLITAKAKQSPEQQ
jgi:predicted dienelactone hydrolase